MPQGAPQEVTGADLTLGFQQRELGDPKDPNSGEGTTHQGGEKLLYPIGEHQPRGIPGSPCPRNPESWERLAPTLRTLMTSFPFQPLPLVGP